MSLNYFDKLVYYQTCDFMYDEFERQKKNKISYQTFSSMCRVIGQKIKLASILNKIESGVINRLIYRVSSFFGFSDYEAINYVYNFFKEEFWSKYQNSVCEINLTFGQAKNI